MGLEGGEDGTEMKLWPHLAGQCWLGSGAVPRARGSAAPTAAQPAPHTGPGAAQGPSAVGDQPLPRRHPGTPRFVLAQGGTYSLTSQSCGQLCSHPHVLPIPASHPHKSCTMPTAP